VTVGDYTLGLSTSNAWLSVILFFALLILSVRAYRPSRSASSLHLGLFFLRFIVLTLAILLLMAPRLRISAKGVRQPLVAFMLDDSESMRIVAGERPRHSAVTELLDAGLTDRISDRARIKTFYFSENLLEEAPVDSARWRGPATDIATSLEQLTSRVQGQGLAGIFLLSDGAHNLGQTPLQASEAYQTPIYTVPIGAGQPPRDVALTSASHPTLGYVGRPIEVRVSLEAVGLDRFENVLRVYDGDRPVSVSPIAIGVGEQEVSVTYTPDQPGERTLRIHVPPQAGEVEARNNEVLTKVEILEGRARVLMVGTPSADFAYLRRVIEADSNVVSDVISPDTPQGWGFRSGAALEDLGRYALVVLHNVPAALLTPEIQRELVSTVTSGGGLLVVGGDESLNAGWGTGLSSVLPTESAGAANYVSGAYSARIPAGAERHSILRLSEDPVAEREAWSALPPFFGMSMQQVSKAATSSVLLENEEGDPLVAVRNAGRGKCAVVGARGFARAGLMMWGIGDTDRVVRSFWQKTIRWLLTKEEVRKLRITTEKQTYRSGEPVSFRAELFDDLLRPVDGAEVLLDIEGGPSGPSIMPGRGKGVYEVRVAGMPQGQHAYRVTAKRGSGDPVAMPGELVVGRYSVEFENLLANTALMDELARRSGGRRLDTATLPAFLDSMKLSPQPHESVYQLDLWGRGWPLALLVVGLAAEWFVRRRRGMV
jgi:hypothetical protein